MPTDAATSQYNVGILYMADRQFDKAISAFEEAARAEAQFEHAEARARRLACVASRRPRTNSEITECLKRWSIPR